MSRLVRLRRVAHKVSCVTSHHHRRRRVRISPKNNSGSGIFAIYGREEFPFSAAKVAPGASQESQTMISRKHAAVTFAIAFIAATSISASAASGFPHFGGKKQQNDPISVRKLTASQNALIGRAIVREHAIVA